MVQPVAWRIVDRADGQFAVIAALPSGQLYCRGGFLTLTEVEDCIEDLRALMTACGVPVIAWFADDGGVEAQENSVWPDGTGA